MGDTFKVTTNNLNDFVGNKLEPLAGDIHGDTDVAQLTTWSTQSAPALLGGPDLAKDLTTAFKGFATRMSDNTSGIERQTQQLSQNVTDVGQQFHATDQNAEWSAGQMSGLLYNLQTDASGEAQ